MIPMDVLCPRCGFDFKSDSNNNLYADCPGCGFRIFMDEVHF